MSAIEVLNVWVNKPIIFDERFMTKEEYIEQVNLKVATQEALLALKKLERVKEITEHWESWYELDENGTGLEDLVDDLKDILNTKKVGEQK